MGRLVGLESTGYGATGIASVQRALVSLSVQNSISLLPRLNMRDSFNRVSHQRRVASVFTPPSSARGAT